MKTQYSARSDGWGSSADTHHRPRPPHHPRRTSISTVWECGSSQKRRQAMSSFAKNSSMHGVRYICPVGGHKISWLKRTFYSLFFVACLIAMCGSVVFLLQDSLGTESVYIATTSKDGETGMEEDPLFPKYPRLTLCRRPGYTTGANASDQRLLEYAFLSLGFPFTSLTPEERMLLVEIVIFNATHRKKKNNNSSSLEMPQRMRDFSDNLDRMKERYDAEMRPDSDLTAVLQNYSVSCDEMFVRCITFLVHFDCCDLFRPTLTSLGVCYSLLTEEAVAKLQSNALNEEFTLIFDLRAAPQIEKAVDIGYEIHLSDPRNKEVAVNRAGYSMINGFATLLKSRLIKTSRVALFTAWHGRSVDCPRLPPELDLMDYGDRFFRAACEKRYLDKLMRENCRCRNVVDQSPVPMRQCDPIDVYGCFLLTARKDNLTGMGRQCVYPCIEYQYECDTSLVKNGYDNISRLIFMYDGTQYSLKEYRTTTISSLLSQIGGALGLYLGASFITALELVNFLVSWLWHWMLPHRRRVQTTSTELSAIPHHQRDKKKCKELYFY